MGKLIDRYSGKGKGERGREGSMRDGKRGRIGDGRGGHVL